jgi:multidrug efflux pump subunit AcrA (membrane-fusion protein)
VPLAITGTIQAGQESNVGTKVAGKIERIAVDEGAAVQRRDLLFRIDQSDLILAEKAARAGLAMVGASLRDAVLVVQNNRVVSQKITPGLAGDSLVEVRGGLAAGEKVVVAGNYGMEENTLIAPQLVPY